VHPQDLGRDLPHQIFGEARLQALGLERGIADGLAAKWVEPSGEVAVHAMCLDERHRRGDSPEQEGRRLRCDRRSVASVGNTWIELANALDERVCLDEILGRLVEERTPRRVDGLGGGQVLREEFLNEPGVEVLEPLDRH
jgi:hypothetical protein